jgi:ArsR family metal-binding transcriptional regulator
MEIKEFLPCIADPEKYRVIGQIDNYKLDEILPYLARIVPKATYNATEGWVSFKKGQKIVTIYKNGFATLTMIKDEEEALSILQELEKKIKLAWKKRHEIDITKPLEKTFIGPLKLYKYLPKTNCKKCGEETCMAYAFKLLNGKKSLKDCKLLFEDSKYIGVRETLISLLLSSGYELEV